MGSGEGDNPYPIVGDIAADIRGWPDGTVALSNERLAHWHDLLQRRYPRERHPALYAMLGGLAYELSKMKALAALQVLLLATYDRVEEANRRAQDDALQLAPDVQRAFSKMRPEVKKAASPASMPAPRFNLSGFVLRAKKRERD